MECPVKPEMEQYALTSALWFQAPGPFKCGPKSKFPTTGVSLVPHFLIVPSQDVLTLTILLGSTGIMTLVQRTTRMHMRMIGVELTSKVVS